MKSLSDMLVHCGKDSEAATPPYMHQRTFEGVLINCKKDHSANIASFGTTRTSSHAPTFDSWQRMASVEGGAAMYATQFHRSK